MAKKDFSNVTADRVYPTIQEATAEPVAQETQQTRKPRKTYNTQEAAEFLQDMKTAGHKGVKLPRINLAFAPDLYDYVRTMSKAAGMTYTEFINKILRDHMEQHADTYQKAIDFRNSL